MKTNQEFLSSMWEQIALSETEEHQKELAKSESKRFARKNSIICLALLIISLSVAVVNIATKNVYADVAYCVAFGLLVLAYLFDNAYLIKNRRTKTQ